MEPQTRPWSAPAAFAVVQLVVACTVQFTGRAPSLAVSVAILLVVALACAVVSVCVSVVAVVPAVAGDAAPRPGRRWAAGIRRGLPLVLAAAACTCAIAARIDAALAARLDPSLDGELLRMTVLVDQLPQRFDFGDRIAARVVDCAPKAPGRAACANLARVQLDWSPLRPRDRDDAAGPDAEAAAWPEPGEYWRIEVRARPPRAAVNPGGFDLELRYLEQGIGALGRVGARARTAPPGGSVDPSARVGVAFEAARSRLRAALEVRAGAGVGRHARELGVVTALALGDQQAIDPATWALFSRTGVSHLMAISGMHVTMIALAFAALLGGAMRGLARWPASGVARLTRGRPRRHWTLGLAVVLAFAYAGLSGWAIPSQRTCWMLLGAALLGLSARFSGPLTATLVATVPIVALDPWAVGSAGFWLSFVAVAALIWAAGSDGVRPPARAAGRGAVAAALAGLRGSATQLLAAQAVATVALLPLTIALFSVVSIAGPLVNLVAIPWVSLWITPASLALVALALPPPDGSIAGLLAGIVWRPLAEATFGSVRLLLDGLALVDRLPWASRPLAPPGPVTLAASLVCALLLVSPVPLLRRRWALLGLLPLLSGATDRPSPDELRITGFDLGQGSAILLRTRDAAILYDTGAARSPDRSAAARVLLPYLDRVGIRQLDLLVVSHLDQQHAGGAAAILAAQRPRRLLLPFDARLLPDGDRLPGRRAADGEPATELVDCLAGRTLAVGTLQVVALAPERIARSRREAADDAQSCVLRIAGPAGAVLLAGDLPRRRESTLAGSVPPGALSADVLVVPGQGSERAAGAALIDAVKPGWALLQVGARNPHRHPHPALLARLASRDVRIVRTDVEGGVELRLRPGREVTVVGARRADRPYWRVRDG